MSNIDPQKIIEYVDSFTGPVEQSFLTDDQLNVLKNEFQKFESSRTFVSSVLKKEDFDQVLDKAVLEGRVYTPSQMAQVDEKRRALLDKDGDRINIAETLISKSGQRIIMSKRLQKILGVLADDFMSESELNGLVSALKADGVPSPEIDRVINSMRKFGAVILQRGVFVALKNLLDEAVGHKIPLYTGGSLEPEQVVSEPPHPAPAVPAAPKPHIPVPKPPMPVSKPVVPITPPSVTPVPPIPKPVVPFVPKPEPIVDLSKKPEILPPQPAPKLAKPELVNPNLTSEELPLVFIEYLKQQGEDYQKIEQGVVADEQFKTFFAALKQRYTHYQKLSEHQMAKEIIIRPALWVKLSAANQTALALLLEHNLPEFKRKTANVAAAAHVEKLTELKNNLTHKA